MIENESYCLRSEYLHIVILLVILYSGKSHLV